MDKPLAERRFDIEQAGDALLRIREIHVDPYSVGNMRRAPGRDSALLIGTGSGIHRLAPTLAARVEPVYPGHDESFGRDVTDRLLQGTG